MSTQIAVRINTGEWVLGKKTKRGTCALTYANQTQAERKAAQVGGEVVGSWPFYVHISPSIEDVK